MSIALFFISLHLKRLFIPTTAADARTPSCTAVDNTTKSIFVLENIYMYQYVSIINMFTHIIHQPHSYGDESPHFAAEIGKALGNLNYVVPSCHSNGYMQGDHDSYHPRKQHYPEK